MAVFVPLCISVCVCVSVSVCDKPLDLSGKNLKTHPMRPVRLHVCLSVYVHVQMFSQ